MRSCSWPNIYDVVRRIDGVFVVLHHQNSIAELFQCEEGTYESVIVSLVQADGWLV